MIPHENPDGTHNDAEHEKMEPFERQHFAPILPGLDLTARYDTVMITFIRGYQGLLQEMMWPMRLRGLPLMADEPVQ